MSESRLGYAYLPTTDSDRLEKVNQILIYRMLENYTNSAHPQHHQICINGTYVDWHRSSFIVHCTVHMPLKFGFLSLRLFEPHPYLRMMTNIIDSSYIPGMRRGQKERKKTITNKTKIAWIQSSIHVQPYPRWIENINILSKKYLHEVTLYKGIR